MKNTKKLRAAVIILVLLTGLARAGGKLTLEESKRLALQNNVRTKNSALESEAARQAQREAFTRYFPSVSASGTIFDASRSLLEITTPGGNLPVYNGNPANLPTSTQFAYMPSTTMGVLGSLKLGLVSAVQPVFAGGRIVNGNRLAALGVEATDEKARLARHEVLRITEEDYWRVVSLDEKMRTAETYEALLRRLLEQVENAWASGLVMKNDVLKVRLKLSELLINKSKVENGRALAAMALCQYIGIRYDPSVELSDPLAVDGPPDAYRADPAEALKTRPEYRLLEDAVRGEELETRMKLGEYLPQVGIGVAGLYMKMDTAEGRTNGVVFGTLSIPLSGWWGGSYALNAQRAQEQIARNNLKDNADLLLLQMERAWQDLTDAYRQVLLSRESKAQAEENLKVNRDSYDNGLSTISDLLEAQALLQQANDQLTEAMAAYRVNLVFYLQITGH